MDKQRLIQMNEAILLTKFNQLNDELYRRIEDNFKAYCVKFGNGEYTPDQLKLVAKKEFIKELSRQLTELL